MAPKTSLSIALSVATIAAVSLSLGQTAKACPFAQYRDSQKPTLMQQIQANSRPLIAAAAVVPGVALAIGLYRGGRSYQG